MQAPTECRFARHSALSERAVDDLPASADLVARAKSLAADVTASRAAAIGEEFAGRADRGGRRCAIHRRDHRADDAGTPPTRYREPAHGADRAVTILNRTGLRVMADAFSASDTPSMTLRRKAACRQLRRRRRRCASEGREARRKGRLVTLLTSRVPQKNFPRSNGHGRSNTVLAGVFQMESADPIPASDLKTSTSSFSKPRTSRSATSCAASARTARVEDRSRHRLDREGDARRPGNPGARYALRRRARHGVPRPLGGVEGVRCIPIGRVRRRRCRSSHRV